MKQLTFIFFLNLFYCCNSKLNINFFLDFFCETKFIIKIYQLINQTDSFLKNLNSTKFNIIENLNIWKFNYQFLFSYYIIDYDY